MLTSLEPCLRGGWLMGSTGFPALMERTLSWARFSGPVLSYNSGLCLRMLLFLPPSTRDTSTLVKDGRHDQMVTSVRSTNAVQYNTMASTSMTVGLLVCWLVVCGFPPPLLLLLLPEVNLADD